MTSFEGFSDVAAVSMASPDQNIQVRFSNGSDGSDVEIWFRPNTYRRYREDDLAHQLARLGSTTWVAYFRARAESHRRSQGLGVDEAADAERSLLEMPNRREYKEALNAIEAEGVSPSGVVRIRTKGLLEWSVEIEPGTVRAFSEERLLTELRSAFRSLMNDRETQAIVLKSELFDMGIPRKWLDMMKDLKARNARRR